MEKMLYTVEELKTLVPISTTGLYKAIQNGDIESYKLMRRRVFPAQAVINYVAKITGSAPKRGAR